MPHALAIARTELNDRNWLDGDYFDFASNSPRLHEVLTPNGTLWVVMSRRRADGGRLYSLSFQLANTSLTRERGGTSGRYLANGDPLRSVLYASNDALLLLMSLRFNPTRPIASVDVVGNSLQTIRRLSGSDVRLLRSYAAATDRWSVFLSYAHEDLGRARTLSGALARDGVNVFRDQEGLRAGEKWWPSIQKAIRRASYVVVLSGPKTHTSKWVRRELDYATSLKRGPKILQIYAGGSLAELADRQGLEYGMPTQREFVKHLVRELRS